MQLQQHIKNMFIFESIKMKIIRLIKNIINLNLLINNKKKFNIEIKFYRNIKTSYFILIIENYIKI